MKKGYFLFFCSIIYSLYIGFQMKEFSEYSKANSDLNLSIPFDIYIQCIITLIIGILGISSILDDFEPIKAYLSHNKKKHDTLQAGIQSSTQFMLFNKRK